MSQQGSDAELRAQIIAEIAKLRSEGIEWDGVAVRMNGDSRFPDKTKSGWESYFKRHRNWVGEQAVEAEPEPQAPFWKETKQRDVWILETNDSRICTVEDAIKKAGVDMAVWEVETAEVSAWDTTMKLKQPEGTPDEDGKQRYTDKPFRAQNNRVRIKLRRKVSEPIERAVGRLLERLENKAPIVPLIRRPAITKLPYRRALEICLMDPHFGMRCFGPGADADWSPEICSKMVLDTTQEILSLAKTYEPFEQIVLPIGNDFFHTDSIWQTTTAGTAQPEADAYYHTFVTGEALMIHIIEGLKHLAPLYLYSIPGNHDRTTSFMLGRILKAYYHHDPNVTVHADESPYKFHRYGVNLIGYEHGHSVAQIRLAALMANECPEDWAATKHGYREWHLGDQHRKGSGKPSVMEEQGVSVEFLPGITAPNEWHRLKSFNWQKRSTMAFVWDHDRGPVARLQVNVDRYLNDLMGRKSA